MERELLFATALENIRKIAKDQSNLVTEDQVKEEFDAFSLGEEQMALVYDYLKKHKIGIGEPVDLDEYLTCEEKDYLQAYLDELTMLEKLSEGEKEAITLSAMAGDTTAQHKLIEAFLPQVVDMAKLYAGQGVFIEDLIGEGNVALTMGVQLLGAMDHAEEASGMLGKMIMDAMEEFITENAEEGKKDNKITDKINKVADAARELGKELGRKVTIEELAEESGISKKAIEEAIRISAGKIEDLEEKSE